MSINEQVEKIALELGFTQIFFVDNDIDNGYPCMALLVYSYEPFPEDEYVSAYYVASNKSFHAMKAFVARLNAEGIEAENLHILIKQAMQKKGLGIMGKNSLLHMKELGSRVVLYSVGIKSAVPQRYDVLPNDICKSCTLCIEACPTNAITESGYERSKCIRNYMDEPPYPEFVSHNIKTYLGCEICMRVCPYNAHIKTIEVPNEAREALSPNRILSGDVKAAKLLLGKNIKTKRLFADAEAIKNNLSL